MNVVSPIFPARVNTSKLLRSSQLAPMEVDKPPSENGRIWRLDLQRGWSFGQIYSPSHECKKLLDLYIRHPDQKRCVSRRIPEDVTHEVDKPLLRRNRSDGITLLICVRSVSLIHTLAQVLDRASYKSSDQEAELELIRHRLLSNLCLDLRGNLVVTLTWNEVIQVEVELPSIE